MVTHSIREYCEKAKARFEECNTFDLRRQFLLDHVQQIVYLRSEVTLIGSVAVQRGTFQNRQLAPFRIVGEIDRQAIRARPQKVRPDDARWRKLKMTITTEKVAAAL